MATVKVPETINRIRGLENQTGDKDVIVYVPLLNEGTAVFRPTLGVNVGVDLYLLRAPDGYDPEDEEWAVLPGSIALCAYQEIGGKVVLVAQRLWSEPDSPM